MYHARIHPEQYSNTLNDEQLKQLHKSVLHICSTAVELLSDSSKFPDEWLFKHRWGKGKKDQKKELPNGEKIIHITVGGRTSAVVPRLQKKTGPVAGDVKSEDIDGDISPTEEDAEAKPAKKRKAGSKLPTTGDAQQNEARSTTGSGKRGRGKKADSEVNDSVKSPAKKRKAASTPEASPPVKEQKPKKARSGTKSTSVEDQDLASGRRSSTRVTSQRV